MELVGCSEWTGMDQNEYIFQKCYTVVLLYQFLIDPDKCFLSGNIRTHSPITHELCEQNAKNT
jgi:hypothetical protein